MTIEWGDAPPPTKQRLQGLTGTDAYLSGKRWGAKAKASYSPEAVAALIRKIGKPTNDHDRGALEGLTT
jgi:hypothetical protein